MVRHARDEFRIMPKFLTSVEWENRAEDDVGAKRPPLAELRSPSHFPVGLSIVVDRKHARHGGECGVVARHTREFVVVRFPFNACSETRIKPKFLTIVDNG